MMMEQMMILYELHYYVASWKQKKMDRLRDRLARDGIEQRGWPDGHNSGD
nr:MAG TPA: hypothetical protein [Caudoviricetes sp.]